MHDEAFSMPAKIVVIDELDLRMLLQEFFYRQLFSPLRIGIETVKVIETDHSTRLEKWIYKVKRFAT